MDIKVGQRVRLIEMNDGDTSNYTAPPYKVPAGSIGTVTLIDDAGQIHVRWDNGSSLALIPESDRFEVMT